MARREEPPLPDSFDPVEIALDAERGDPSPDSPARTLLLEQIALTRQDQAHRRLQIAAERFGGAMKLLGAGAGLAVAVFVGMLLWDAHKASGLVVDAFSTPPDLAARGLSGQVAAARFLDQMRTLQDATDTARAAASYGNDWSQSFKVEIPGSGVSIDDVQRWLRGWLGHETHVSGEIVRTATGFELTVRAGDQPGQTYAGPDLAALMKEAAVGVYRQQQPYRYAIWLGRQGRNEEGAAALRRLAFEGPREEQAFAMAGLANHYNFFVRDPRHGLALALRARALDPAAEKPWWNIVDSVSVLDRQEDLLAAERAIIAHRPDPMIAAAAAGQVHAAARATVAALQGDYRAAAAFYEQGARLADYGANRQGAMAQQVANLALAHDPAASRAAQALYGDLIVGPDFRSLTDYAQAAALGDWAAAARAPFPAGVMSYPAGRGQLALVRARAGDVAGAKALLAGLADDCHGCLIARAEIAARSGDASGADRLFAEVLRRSPSIVDGYLAWGDVKLRRGDAAGAAALFARAADKGPRSPDAYGGWGRALLAQGDARGALGKLMQADRLAPAWGRNHILLGEAYRRLGQQDAARREWLTARGLEMTAGERARLEYLLKGGR